MLVWKKSLPLQNVDVTGHFRDLTHFHGSFSCNCFFSSPVPTPRLLPPSRSSTLYRSSQLPQVYLRIVSSDLFLYRVLPPWLVRMTHVDSLVSSTPISWRQWLFTGKSPHRLYFRVTSPDSYSYLLLLCIWNPNLLREVFKKSFSFVPWRVINLPRTLVKKTLSTMIH